MRTLIVPGPDSSGHPGLFEACLAQFLPEFLRRNLRVVLISSVLPAGLNIRQRVTHYACPLHPDLIREIALKEEADMWFLYPCGQEVATQFTLWIESGLIPDLPLLGCGLDAMRVCIYPEVLAKYTAGLKVTSSRHFICRNMVEVLEYARRVQYPVLISEDCMAMEWGTGICSSSDEVEILALPLINHNKNVLIREYQHLWNQIQVNLIAHDTIHILSVSEAVEAYNIQDSSMSEFVPVRSFSQQVLNRVRESAKELIEELGLKGPVTIYYLFHPATAELKVRHIAPWANWSMLLTMTIGQRKVANQIVLGLFEAPGDVDVVFGAHGYTLAMPSWDSLAPVSERIFSDSSDPVLFRAPTLRSCIQQALEFLSRSGQHWQIRPGIEYSLRELRTLSLSSRRLLGILCSLRNRGSVSELMAVTGIQKTLLEDIRALVETEDALKVCRGMEVEDDLLLRARHEGFSETLIAKLLDLSCEEIHRSFKNIGAEPSQALISVSEPRALVSGYSAAQKSEVHALTYGLEESVLELQRQGINVVLIHNRLSLLAPFRLAATQMLPWFPSTESQSWIWETGLFSVQIPEEPCQFQPVPNLRFLTAFRQLKIEHADWQIVADRDELHSFLATFGFPAWIVEGSSCNRVVNLAEADLIWDMVSERPEILILRQKAEALEFHMDGVFGQDKLVAGVVSQHIGPVDTMDGDTVIVHPAPDLDMDGKKELLVLANTLCKYLGVLGLFGMHVIRTQNGFAIRNFWIGATPYNLFHSRVAGASLPALSTRVRQGLSVNFQIHSASRYVFVKAPIFVGGLMGRSPSGHILGVANEFDEALRLALMSVHIPQNPDSFALILGNLDYIDEVWEILDALYFLKITCFVSRPVYELIENHQDYGAYFVLISDSELVDLMESSRLGVLVLPPAAWNSAAVSRQNRILQVAQRNSVACFNHVGLARRYVHSLLRGNLNLEKLAPPSQPLVDFKSSKTFS
ncbi:MAG: hypothetical protein H3C47_10995 [Candidatus Cloacimonetes bacterium]|nr:hypothetical protein [Candidatus Cloacimonadota bacterium]